MYVHVLLVCIVYVYVYLYLWLNNDLPQYSKNMSKPNGSTEAGQQYTHH